MLLKGLYCQNAGNVPLAFVESDRTLIAGCLCLLGELSRSPESSFLTDPREEPSPLHRIPRIVSCSVFMLLLFYGDYFWWYKIFNIHKSTQNSKINLKCPGESPAISHQEPSWTVCCPPSHTILKQTGEKSTIPPVNICLYESAPLSNPLLQHPPTHRHQRSTGPTTSPPIDVKQGHPLLHM